MAGEVAAPALYQNTIMYDTINMFYPLTDTCKLDRVAERLENTNTKKNTETGDFRIYGCMENYKVNVSFKGVHITGSLSQYHYGNATDTLTRYTTQLAIERMSDRLQLNIADAYVTRMDVAANIPVSKPVPYYLTTYGDKPHFKRLKLTETSLRYDTQRRSLALYDKANELKIKKYDVPPSLANQNLLRYEMRLTKRIAAQMGRNARVTAGDLFNERFYVDALQLWKNEYKTIPRTKPIVTSMDDLKNKTPRELKNLFCANAIDKTGGNESISNYLALLKEAGADKKTIYQTKKMLLKTLSSKEEEQVTTDEIGREIEYISLWCR